MRMADKPQSQTTNSQEPVSSFGQHANAYVPHHISDHTKAVQMSVMTDDGWVNINDTLDQMNDRKDLHVVHDDVSAAQQDISKAQSAAQDAYNRADSAVKAAAVTSDTVANMSDAVIEATSGTSDAVTKAQSALNNLAQAKNELQTSINKNSEAITLKADKTIVDKDRTSMQSYAASVDVLNSEVALKADKTAVDKLNDTVTQNNASIEVLNGAIKNKVTESDVEGLLTKKDYATQTYTQDLVTQTAKTWGVNLSKLEGTVKDNQAANIKQMTNLQVSIDGIQGTVKNKADQSQVTQLANALQIKMTGTTIAQADSVTLTFTGKDNEYLAVAVLNDIKDITKDSKLVLSFDYEASDDVSFIPQLDGSPWTPWGTIKDNTVITAKKGKAGAYSMTITVADDSWQKGTAKNLCIRCDKYKGTLKITNLVLKYADTVHNVQSTFDMLRDDINLRVTKDKLISQINMEAGRTLIQSNKIYLDADSVVFGKDSKAFIPDAAITELDADKIKSGTIQSINLYGNDIVSFNKETDTTGYGFAKINDGTLYLGETEKPDPSLIDTEEKIGNIDVAHLTAAPNGGMKATGNSIEFSTPESFINLEKVGNAEDVLEIWSKEKISIADGFRNIGLYINSRHTARNQTLKYPVDGLFAQSYLGKDNVLDIDRKTSGIFTGIAMDEDWLALASRKGVTVNLSGTDDDSYKSDRFAIQKDDVLTATWGDGANGDEIQQTAAGRIGLHAFSGTMYFDKNDHGSWHEKLDDFHVFGNFNVENGQKNSVVRTSQGATAVHAYETAEYYFGDIGESNTGDNGKIILGIDQLFGQTVNTGVQYQVFVTPYSNARVWVSQRLKDRFVVESDQPNAEFGWEIKARRKGFEHTRLTNFN